MKQPCYQACARKTDKVTFTTRPLYPSRRGEAAVKHKMTRITTLGKALKVLSFYRWAFGDLTEQDSDVGMLAEYLVGDILNRLPPTRKVQASFDLIMKDGTTLEIKATTHKREKKGRTPYYCWDVSTQKDMLKGNRPIADYWVFLIADFPRETSRKPRVVQAFDLKNWKCYVVSGEKLRTAGCAKYVSESTLQRLEVEAFPLVELKKRFNHEIH